MPVITISRELGSLGTQIAEDIAIRINAQCVDKEVMALVAHQAGVPVQVVIEEEEHLLSRQLAIGKAFHTLLTERWTETDCVLKEDSYTNHLGKAIETFAAENESIVFVGRGAQMVLSHKDPRIFHAHIYAARETRIERIQIRRGIADYDEVRQIIDRADMQRRDWYRRFYAGANWKDPRHYHLMLNTSRISVETAVNLIIEAAESEVSSPAANA